MTGYALSAQYAEDALRFSQFYYQGTARSMATGNALGAMGADFSVLSTNPAGIGVYRSSEFNISPEIAIRNASSTYNGILADDRRSLLNLSNIGFVGSNKLRGSNWQFINIGFGMNRLNNFNTNTVVRGDNTKDSRLDVYLDEAFNILDDGGSIEDIASSDPFYLAPAWDTYLLDTISDDQYLYLFTPVPFGGVRQTEVINTRGSMNEWLFSIGGNYNDKLYIGATIGLPYLRYLRESYYTEVDIQDTIPYFDHWELKETLSTFGWGINIKFGIIVKPVEWLRIGGAFHSPTSFWSMTDKWNTHMTSDLEWTDGEIESTPNNGTYDYSLSTPMRAIGNLGFVIGQMGFVSAEYEFADYTNAKLKAKGFSFPEENQHINEFFTATHNFRFGTEWRVQNLSLRGGYAMYSSPYKSLSYGSRKSFSGGIGYRIDGFAIDIAYVRSVKEADYYLYSTNNYQTNAAQQTFTDNSVVVSLKFVY